MGNTEINELYEFIGNLAIALYSQKIKIRFASLNAILSDQNEEWEYGNHKGLGQGLAAAYKYWERKDPVIYHAIAYTFTNKDGKLAWEDYI